VICGNKFIIIGAMQLVVANLPFPTVGSEDSEGSLYLVVDFNLIFFMVIL
jgi:hypothetical protein